MRWNLDSIDFAMPTGLQSGGDRVGDVFGRDRCFDFVAGSLFF
jgi:hypothetical protein